VSDAVTVDGLAAPMEGRAVIPPVSVPLPVPSGLLVDLIEVLEVHAQALEVRSDGEVLTITAATRSSGAPVPAADPAELASATAAPRTTGEVPLGPPAHETSSNGAAPPSPRPPAVRRPCYLQGDAKERTSVDDVLAAVVAVSGFDLAALRDDRTRTRPLSSWRKVAAYVAYQRGARPVVVADRLHRTLPWGRRCVNEVEGQRGAYQAMIDRVVAHLDGARAASASTDPAVRDLSRGDVDDGPPPADLDHAVAPARLEGDGDELAEMLPPPSPGFPPPPPMPRRPFDPDAARARAGAAL
jgi:hypothetical protein